MTRSAGVHEGLRYQGRCSVDLFSRAVADATSAPSVPKICSSLRVRVVGPTDRASLVASERVGDGVNPLPLLSTLNGDSSRIPPSRGCVGGITIDGPRPLEARGEDERVSDLERACGVDAPFIGQCWAEVRPYGMRRGGVGCGGEDIKLFSCEAIVAGDEVLDDS